MSKVILISEGGYSPEYDELLLSFLDHKFELFCVVGKDCELWEYVMDELTVGNGENPRFITTTSHPDESIKKVIESVKMFTTKTKNEVQVVRI